MSLGRKPVDERESEVGEHITCVWSHMAEAWYQYRPANSPRGPLSATILFIVLHVEVELLPDATDKEETLLVSKTHGSFERDLVKREKKKQKPNCGITIQCMQLSKFHLPSSLDHVKW